MVHSSISISICGHQIEGLHKSYADVLEKQPLAYLGSIGSLEVAINRGNAANFFGALLFDEVKVILNDFESK